jgi:hypothetical protein
VGKAERAHPTRYYSDIDRTKEAIKGIGGKRLAYHQTH